MPPKDYEQTTPERLNPLLSKAINDYFDRLKAECIEKAIVGDLEYQGKWLDFSPDEMQKYSQEELLDLHVYRAMTRSRFGSASKEDSTE